MKLHEFILWWLIGIVPKKYGKRYKTGYFYDSYHDTWTGRYFVLEKATGRFLER